MTLSYQEAKDRSRRATQKSMQTLYRMRRSAALDAYGNHCVICNNPKQDELQIVPRKGWQWSRGRTEKPIRGGHEKMRWLDQNNFPDTHTIVCGPQFSPCRRQLQLLD